MGGNSSKSDDPNEIGANAPPEQLIKAAKDHPFNKGHPILREFADALEKEYVFRQGAIVGDFEDSLSDQRVSSEGVDIKDFKDWFVWVEALVRESYFEQRNIATMNDIRQWWGLVAAAPYGQVAQATPSYPGAQAYPQAAGYPGAVPVATAVPVASTNYPSQAGVPVATATPAVAVATPVQY